MSYKMFRESERQLLAVLRIRPEVLKFVRRDRDGDFHFFLRFYMGNSGFMIPYSTQDDLPKVDPLKQKVKHIKCSVSIPLQK